MNDGILEFTFRPKTNKKAAITLLVFLLAVSLVFVVFSVISLRYRGLISLAAVGFMCAGVYVYTRYIGAEYAYAVIFDSNDVANVIVTKLIGKRVTTLANFPLHTVCGVFPEKEAPVPNGEVWQKCNFSVSIGEAERYVVLSKDRYSRRRIIFECTREVANRLSDYAIIAKEAARLEDYE